MKLTQWYAEDTVHLGLVLEGGVFDITAHAQTTHADLPLDMSQAMAKMDALATFVKAIPAGAPLLDAAELRHAPMVLHPEKILCVGLNYRMHALETGNALPPYPVLFSKCANTLSAHGEEIPMPKVSTQIDYEAELVLIVGKTCKDVAKEEAHSFLFGYTLGNDLSARDLQNRTSQWLVGKSLDRFAPTGPCVVTADSISPHALDLSLRVNGITRQTANTSDMIFDCAEIVSYISHMMTLKPGDLIFTGTPSGVAMGYPQGQQPWLRTGDHVEVSCPEIGTLCNTMV